MDCLRRPCAIVVSNVLGNDTPDVIDTEEDEVVQGFFAQRAVKTFDIRRSIGCAVGDGKTFDAHDLTKPLVEVAAVGARLAVALDCHGPTKLTEDAIVVMDQEAWRNIRACRLSDLLLHPRQCGMARDVDMHDKTRSHLHHYEHVGDGEEGGVLRQEVTGPHLAGVVANESAPGLVATGCAPHHVDSDGAGGVVDAKLGGQFLGDLVLSPAGLVGGDASDEGDVGAWDPWTADLARARLATPGRLEAFAVPADDSGRLYDDKRASGVGPETVKGDPECPIRVTKFGSLLSPDVNSELLTQSGIFQRQACPRHQRGPHEGKQGR